MPSGGPSLSFLSFHRQQLGPSSLPKDPSYLNVPQVSFSLPSRGHHHCGERQWTRFLGGESCGLAVPSCRHRRRSPGTSQGLLGGFKEKCFSGTGPVREPLSPPWKLSKLCIACKAGSSPKNEYSCPLGCLGSPLEKPGLGSVQWNGGYWAGASAQAG